MPDSFERWLIVTVGTFWLLSVATTNATAQLTAEQTSLSTRQHTFDFRGMPLREALERLADSTEISLVYDHALIANKAAFCLGVEMTAPALLRCLLDGTRLEAVQLSSGVFVLRETGYKERGFTRSTQKHTVSGYVRDAKTGEHLIGASIYEQRLKLGAASNNFGFYSLTLPADSIQLVVSYVGYRPATFTLLLHSNQTLNIDLQPLTLSLDSLEVVASRLNPIRQRTQMSAVEIPIQTIQEMPAMLGEVDVLRTLHLLPGVQSGAEGTNGLYVRGGRPDQNLVLLDGAPLYNTAHLLGFLSAFNSDAVQNVELIKGGFPARYGGRLSSVVEVNVKEGNMKEFVGQGTLGLLSSHLLIEGPLAKDKTSFVVSGRRSWLDLAASVFRKDKIPRYVFYDVHAKVNHVFSQRDRLYGSLFRSMDGLRATTMDKAVPNRDSLETQFRLKWGTTLTTLRWNHVFGPKLFGNALFLWSDYQLTSGARDVEPRITEEGTVDEVTVTRYHSSVRDVGLKLDFDLLPTPNHLMRLGAHATYHRYTTGTLELQTSRIDEPNLDTLWTPDAHIGAAEGALYAEDEVRLSSRLQVNAGVRASGFHVGNKTYFSVEPRLSARYLVSATWAMKLSYARMTQYVHLLTTSGVGNVNELWVPATQNVRPQQAYQLAAALSHSIGDRYEISLESFYKNMENLIAYREGADYLTQGKTWEDNVTAGRGWSYGVELFVQKRQGRSTGWLGYTLAWSKRRFEALNEGRTFPDRYDRRHDIALVLTHRISNRMTLSGSWTYGTGNAITLPISQFRSGDIWGYHPFNNISPLPELTWIEKRNGFRMRAYHRLDLGWNYYFGGTHSNQVLRVGLYNAYNRRNPYLYYLATQLGEISGLPERTAIKQVSLFPILPAISYSLSF